MLKVVDGSPRKLQFKGEDIAIGGNSNRLGIYSTYDGLYLDGEKISESDTTKKGLYTLDDKVFYGDTQIILDEIPPMPSKYWNPPKQEPSVYKPWDYVGLIAEYDKLMEKSNGYIKKYRYEINGQPVLTKNGGYELYHYILEPSTYTKTIFIQAGIHGNEMDAKQQLLRVVDILINKINTRGYEVFKPIREDCRLVIIPCVSPYGHQTSGMNIPYPESQYGINLNRNYDINHQYALESPGCGGNTVMEMEEVQHTRDVLEMIGIQNIDYAQDWHDGGNVAQHYWINYAVDGDNRTLVDDFVKHLVEKYKVEKPIIPNCRDSSSTGTCSTFMAKSLGMIGSVVEWMGGIFGYDFNTEQMTHSMDIRGNMILLAYNTDIKGWRINESSDSVYFHFDYPKTLTRDTIRQEGYSPETKVSDGQIYARWDKLCHKYSNNIVKSDILGQNAYGQNIHTYTFGKGNKKVLYVGGIKRFGANYKIDEFAIYQLIEYLCDDYIVNQSKYLQDLRDNYTIVVLPCIDNVAGNTTENKHSGLNNMALGLNKWQIVNDKCQPTTYAMAQHDVPIVKTIIDNNKDLKCIVSGGEDCSKYGANTQDYTTDFETHIVLPRNQINNINNYKTHLETNRNEFVVIECTKGTTFGDYAYDNYGIPTYYIQLKVSKRFNELRDYHNIPEEQYLHNNYETGRRMANIVNLFIS